jgi:phenylpropionate dioxygenase-like ring-hydroxylating dioxygenase large terminal subunit
VILIDGPTALPLYGTSSGRMTMSSMKIPADWAQAIVDPGAFRQEQDRLAYAWTFLGFTSAAPNDGDWFRCMIATRSVFVQRFGEQIKGFENVCAHRFFPIRLQDRGNGPIICRFHGWQYDVEGRAVGIPLCLDLFGATPRDMQVRLRPIEIETCGTLIFGRFANARLGGSLSDFLGDVFPILEAMSKARRQPQFLSQPIKANWRLCLHISLDDYHIASVHPTTLGKHGHLDRKNRTYVRLGLNGLYTTANQEQVLGKMKASCLNGTFHPTNYCIFHIVPNLLVVLFPSEKRVWHCLVHCFDPVRHDRSMLRAWLYSAPFKVQRPWLRAITDVVRRPIVRHYVRRVFREDSAIVEHVQKAAHQMRSPPLLGALEERIGWFEDSYRQLLKLHEVEQEPPSAAR